MAEAGPAAVVKVISNGAGTLPPVRTDCGRPALARASREATDLPAPLSFIKVTVCRRGTALEHTALSGSPTSLHSLPSSGHTVRVLGLICGPGQSLGLSSGDEGGEGSLGRSDLPRCVPVVHRHATEVAKRSKRAKGFTEDGRTSPLRGRRASAEDKSPAVRAATETGTFGLALGLALPCLFGLVGRGCVDFFGGDLGGALGGGEALPP